jgi:hypothetical protein
LTRCIALLLIPMMCEMQRLTQMALGEKNITRKGRSNFRFLAARRDRSLKLSMVSALRACFRSAICLQVCAYYLSLHWLFCVFDGAEPSLSQLSLSLRVPRFPAVGLGGTLAITHHPYRG